MGNSITAAATVQSSELSRNSASVFAAADRGPVTITRRDGESLVLRRASDAARDRAGLDLAAHLVAASLASDAVPFARRLAGPFPWVEFLSPPDRELFATEVVDVARACASIAQFDRLLTVVAAWRSTAAALAAGYTPDEELDWLAEPVAVPDPRTT